MFFAQKVCAKLKDVISTRRNYSHPQKTPPVDPSILLITIKYDWIMPAIGSLIHIRKHVNMQIFLSAVFSLVKADCTF